MKLTPIAVIALVLAAACGGNKDNSTNGAPPPSTTTDTSAGQMSPSTQPATPAMPDTTAKMSGKKHHTAGADTTMH